MKPQRQPLVWQILSRFVHLCLRKGALLAIIIVFITPIVFEQTAQMLQSVPYRVNFQGRLTDDSGNVKPDGMYNMRIRLMSAPTGGTNLWQADRIYTGGNDYRVQVTNGLFSIQLGDTVANDPVLSAALFNTQTHAGLYLEIELPTPATATCNTNSCQSWTEGAMTPRSPFASAGYAFNADTVDGIDGEDIVLKNADNTYSGVNTYDTQTNYNWDSTYGNWSFINWNQVYDDIDDAYYVQADGRSSQLANTPDDGFALRVSAYKSSGQEAANQTLLVGYAPTDSLAGLIDNGVTYGNNLISNPGFEFGCAGWVACGSATDTDDPYSGLREYKFVMADENATYDINSRKVAVHESDQLYTSVKVKTSASTTGEGGIYVQFFNESGVSVGFSDADYTNPGTSYVTKSWVHSVPAGAAYATMALTVRGNLGSIPATTGGSWYFDDAVMYMVNRTGPAAFRSEVNSNTAFQVQDSSYNTLFNVDTNAQRTGIAANNTATLSQLVVSQAGGGDAALSVANATNNYSIGIDASDNTFKLGTNASSYTAGYTTFSNALDSSNQNYMLASLVQANKTGDVTTLRTHFGSVVAGNVQMALYDDDGTKTAPDTLLASSSSVSPSANNWVDFTIPSTGVTQGEYYWIVINQDNNTNQVNFVYPANGIAYAVYTPGTFASWPGSWPGGGGTDTAQAWAVNMEITPQTQTDQFSSTSLSIDKYGQTVFQSQSDSITAFQIQSSSGTQLFNANTQHQIVTVGSNDSKTQPTLQVVQSGSGDASLSVSNDSNRYFMGIDSSDNNKLKFSTFASSSTSGPATYNVLTDAGNSGIMVANLVQAKTSGWLDTINVRIGAAAAGTIQAAIYSDNGTRSVPNARLAFSGDVAAAANSWVEIDMSGVFVTAGTHYWLVVGASSNTTAFHFASMDDGAMIHNLALSGYGTWPSTWPVSNLATPGQGFALNMDVTTEEKHSHGDQFETSSFSIGAAGEVLVKPSSDTTKAFGIQNSLGQEILNVNTLNSAVTVKASDRQFTDLVTIDASTNAPLVAGANGLRVAYRGGVVASSEGAGIRIDYGLDTAASSTASGLRIIPFTGASSTQSSYGIKIDNLVSPSSGTERGMYVGTGWDIGVDVQSGGLQLATQSDPSSPATDNLRIYAKNIAGRAMPTYRDSTNRSTPLQASLGFNRVAWSAPGYRAAGSGACGLDALTYMGTIPSISPTSNECSTPTPSSGSLLNSSRKTRFGTTGTSNRVSYQYQNDYMTWRGNSSGLGGFFYSVRFGMSSVATGNRGYIGLLGNNLVPWTSSANPMTDSGRVKIGVAMDSDTGNWNLIHNASSVSPTVTDLGSSFAVNATTMYDLVLYAAPNGSSVGYMITNLTTGVTTSGSISSNLPSSTSFMMPVAWVSNVTTASNVALDMAGWYLESDI